MIACLLLLALAGQSVQVPQQIQERAGHSVNVGVKPDDLKSPRLPPGIALDRALTPDDAVAIALWNNAALYADLARLGLARADLVEAGLLRNLNLSLLIPVGPKPFELAITGPIEVIWQRPKRIEAAKVNLEVVAHGLVQHGLDLARDAALSQLVLALAQERSAIEGEGAVLQEQVAELTARRLRAGDVSEVEAGLARANATAARDAALRSSEAIRQARESLRLAIGLRGDSTELCAAPMGQALAAWPDLAELLETAWASRPDLRAAELSVQAAARRAGWQRSRIFALGLVLSSKEVGSYGVRTGPGLAFDLPLFDRNQGAIRRADAEVEVASWQYLAARDRVEMEVRVAWAQSLEARANIRRLRDEVMPTLRQNMELAQKSYRSGEVSYLDVLESTRPLFDARIREVEATAAVWRADAHLQRSIGRKP